MGNKSNDKDKENLVYFSDLKDRQKQKKVAKKARKEREKREKLEEEYRRQYRAKQQLQAKIQIDMARKSAGISGKTPFINWSKIPPFTRTIVIAFIAVQLVISFALNDAQRLILFMNFGFVPAYYSGTIPWTWSALIAPFTTAFIHGSWMHLLTNCIMMMAMGVFFERQMGTRNTLIFFIFSLMCGNLAYFILNPASTTPVVGASGAISGLFGAVTLMMNFNGLKKFGAQKLGSLPLVLLWITIMITIGMVSSNTAWQSHLGGFIGGVGLFQLWRKNILSF